MRDFRLYMLVGGMPQVVDEYIRTNNFRLVDQVKRDIIGLIRRNPGDGEEATDLLMVAKYFERIGDHATNIAEWVIYSLKKTEEEV